MSIRQYLTVTERELCSISVQCTFIFAFFTVFSPTGVNFHCVTESYPVSDRSMISYKSKQGRSGTQETLESHFHQFVTIVTLQLDSQTSWLVARTESETHHLKARFTGMCC